MKWPKTFNELTGIKNPTIIANALCWSSRKCNCACALPAEVQLRLGVTRRSWQKLFAGKNFVKILVTAQTQLRLYGEQQRAFGNSNIYTGGAGKARFNVATPTYEARTRPLHVQHTYCRIIFKQNPFNIISREVQGCTSTDFRLK